MNLIVVIGVAVLIAGVTGVLVGVLYKRGSAGDKLSVSDIQARLAEEDDSGASDFRTGSYPALRPDRAGGRESGDDPPVPFGLSLGADALRRAELLAARPHDS